MSLTNDGRLPSVNAGDTIRVGFDPERAVILPHGQLADE
jgi:hypothetical protein